MSSAAGTAQATSQVSKSGMSTQLTNADVDRLKIVFLYENRNAVAISSKQDVLRDFTQEWIDAYIAKVVANAEKYVKTSLENQSKAAKMRRFDALVKLGLSENEAAERAFGKPKAQ